MKDKKTLFIFGISSFVGSNLARIFKDEYRIIGTYFNTPVEIDNVLSIKCDVLDKEYVQKLMYMFKPEYAIYCVGLTSFADGLKAPTLSEALNTNGVFSVSSATERCRAKLIYLSSHFVFSGENVQFKEDDMPMPCTRYGNDLASSEFYIQRSCLNYLIFRTAPILGKSYHPLENKFIELIESNVKQGKSIPCDDEISHGYITIKFLANIIREALKRNLTNRSFQIGSKDICTRYEFARKYLQKKNIGTNLLQKKTWPFPRTENKVALKDLDEKLFFDVDLSAAESELGIKMPSISSIVNELVNNQTKDQMKGSDSIEFI